MLTFFISGGFFMYFQLICLLLVLGLAVKAAIPLTGRHARAIPGGDAGIHAVLFWGAMAMVLGFLAHYMGLYEAMGSIATANDISPGVVAKGYQMALVTVLSGMATFILSALLWFVLRWRYQSLLSEAR